MVRPVRFGHMAFGVGNREKELLKKITLSIKFGKDKFYITKN